MSDTHLIMGEKERVADFWSYYESAGRDNAWPVANGCLK